jgi:Acetyltransferases, including N-acetylases of ribosomal proteins
MIELRKATIKDRRKAYQWLYFSDFSDFLNHLQGYTNDNLPSYEKFQSDYDDYFFTGSHEEKGRCYIIVSRKNGKTEDIGIISYTSFHLLDKITEFDIWLKGRSHAGQGYGTQAIIKLASIIKDMGYDNVIMRPSKHNTRAIRSYIKAGFVEEELVPANYYLPEYIGEFADGDYGPGGDVFMVLYL